MTPRPGDPSGFGRLDIARALAVMVVLVLVVGAGLERERPDLRYPPPTVPDAAEEPIESEAGVFRVRATDLGVAPDFTGERQGHVRSLVIYRRLRAYPGAPPRVPHGLTEEEFRRTTCNVCHLRGGWVARFGTYAPVTPHPELTSCLQCHVPLDELVGRPLPESEDALVCAQCHVDPDAPPRTFVETDWRPAEWPRTDLQAMEGSPNLIPHELELRNDCLACHGGPAAVPELRTEHPERVGCRQCHVPAGSGDGVWPGAGEVEAEDETAGGGGGAR